MWFIKAVYTKSNIYFNVNKRIKGHMMPLQKKKKKLKFKWPNFIEIKFTSTILK